MQFHTVGTVLEKHGQEPGAGAELIKKLLSLGPKAQYRVLELFDPSELKVHSREDFPVEAKEAVIADTETTGKDAETAGLLELGMVKFCYNSTTMEVYGVTGVFSQLEDPGIEISPDAARVNGITQEMVAGHKIADEEVNSFLAGVGLVIAHNARFDRVVCERRFPVFAELPWACSYKEVNWLETWGPGASLESICFKQGFFFVAHRAFTDCFALLRALCEEPPAESGKPSGLKQLFASARQPSYRVWASKAHFDQSPLLKERGYTWNPGTAPGSMKAWNTMVQDPELQAELDWLGNTIFGGKEVILPVERLTAKTRYSSRFTRPNYLQWPRVE